MSQNNTADRILGARARRLRGRRPMREVVDAARVSGHGLTQSALSLLERGQKGWTTAYMQAVADGLGVPVEVFIGPEPSALEQMRSMVAGLAQEAARFFTGSDDGPGPNAGAAAYLGGLALATG